ncbi:hypothetical protein [Cyanobium sp. NS01]|uniref:hypothetical protein n=1 Tax=Cyanobium sp. NS01 TaxID=261284 RepID=UPI001CECE642|nr:hypothetical protein [Cyanobium sp. NS01]
MQQLRHQYSQRPPLLPQLRRQALNLLLALLAGWLLWPSAAQAAEVLQVRGNGQLQVGDGNRSYTVALACIRIDPSGQAEVADWLRSDLPRRSRVNLRPMGTADGMLLARVTRLAPEGSDQLDLGASLVQRGLATPDPDGIEDCRSSS